MRIDALSIMTKSETKAKLKEEYGKMIRNIQKTTVAARLKNTDLSGDPSSGSVEVNRLQNTDSAEYGTARGAKAGVKVKADPVTVAVDVDKELINEIEEKDLRLFGVNDLIARKRMQNQLTMGRELERAFFNEAFTSATDASLQGATVADKMEELIQKLETVKNDYVDGVPRDMISIIMTPKNYGEVRDYLDTLPAFAGNTTQEDILGYHGVKVFSSTYLPATCEMLAMVDGAVAQPIHNTIVNPDKFQASNAWYFGMFYSYGTKTVEPDLIFKSVTAA